MPTYDYVCRFCEHAFEHFQGMSEALLVKCPACGRRGLERKIGAGIGVVFKGSGFYETDYKRAGKSKDEGGGKGSSGDGAAPAKADDKGADASKASPPKDAGSDAAPKGPTNDAGTAGGAREKRRDTGKPGPKPKKT